MSKDLDTNYLLEAALSYLGHAVWIYTNNTAPEAVNPTSNEGSKFENSTFTMRSFCWCDGARHKDGCPPNFEYDDFTVEWYKYLGRGMGTNYSKSPKGINSMLVACIESLGSGGISN